MEMNKIMKVGVNVEVHLKLKEILTERNITQKQLVEMTGLRAAAVSELVNNQRTSISKVHIARICEALEIEEISEILELKR